MLQNIKKIMELGEKVFEDATISITINYENIINEFEQVRLDEQYKERQLILESIVKNGKKVLD